MGLGALGQQPESLAAGEEATQLFGVLALHDPDRHGSHLATAMENLAISLSAMGRHDECRAASEQAVALRRSDVQALAPVAFAPAQHPGVGGPGRCWCSCHTAAVRHAVDTVATTGPTPVVR